MIKYNTLNCRLGVRHLLFLGACGWGVGTAPDLSAQTRLTERPPGRPTATVVATSGPPPQNVKVTGSPLITYVNWTVAPPDPGTIYTVQRWMETDVVCCSTQVNGLQNPYWVDEGLRWPGTFLYRITAFYPDGRVGSVDQRWVRPDPVNPKNFIAKLVSPTTVRLEWDPVPGAGWYQLSGPGVPAPSFQSVYTFFIAQNLPSGTHTWRVGTALSTPTVGPAIGPPALFPQAAAVVP